MAWVKNGTETLTSASLDLDLGVSTALTKYKFSTLIYHVINDGTGSSNDSAPAITFDNVGTASYANRVSENGASDSTFTSQNLQYLTYNTVKDDFFSVVYICAIDGEEQLMQSWTVDANSSGAATVPTRNESINKYTGTSQFTRVDNYNNRGTTVGYEYDTDSNATILGSDGVEELNVQDGAVYYDTDLNKEYVLYNNTWTEV